MKNMPYYRKTTSQFIAEAQKVHGEKLDYSEVEYVNTHTPVRIRCRRCGVVFLQSPANHLVGRSCPKCSKKQTHKRVTQEMFIARARELHGDKYDYSKTDYQDMRSSLLAFKTKRRKRGQNKSAQGNALGIVSNQHSPRMGKRIIISPPPLPFSNGGLSFFCPLRGRIPAASNSPGVARG